MITFGIRSLTFAAIAAVSTVASAQIFNLSDAGSTASIDAGNGTMFDLSVGGIDQVFAHTYYLRNGDGGTASGLDTFNLDSSSQPLTNFLQLVYSNATFRIQIRYLLTGGISQADMAETVVVTNISNQSASLRLFQYSDWDMGGTAGGDTVTRQNSSTMQQTDGAFVGSIAIHGGTPIPDYSEMEGFPNVRNDITSVNGYFLDTAAGSGIGQTFIGNGTYGFQWNRSLAAGAQFSLSTNKLAAVPEPGSMIALGLGVSALLARRRRRKTA